MKTNTFFGTQFHLSLLYRAAVISYTVFQLFASFVSNIFCCCQTTNAHIIVWSTFVWCYLCLPYIFSIWISICILYSDDKLRHRDRCYWWHHIVWNKIGKMIPTASSDKQNQLEIEMSLCHFCCYSYERSLPFVVVESLLFRCPVVCGSKSKLYSHIMHHIQYS